MSLKLVFPLYSFITIKDNPTGCNLENNIVNVVASYELKHYGATIASMLVDCVSKYVTLVTTASLKEKIDSFVINSLS